MLRFILIGLFFHFASFNSFAQKEHMETYNKMIDSVVKPKVAYIQIEQLKKDYTGYTILDTREKSEFEVSHLKNAIHVGYDLFDIKKVTPKLSKNKAIVVYCSIGYRSNVIAKKLQKKGYTVFNLYGGIFHWKNLNNTIVNQKGETTNKVHAFNKEWGKWLINAEKIYE